MTNEELFAISYEVSLRLKESGKKLAVAESFTGGTVSSALVSIEGASSFLVDAIVCYSHEAKEFRLGIDESILSEFGAVSEQTISAMLDGLMSSPLAPDYALATTGNAGPGAEEKSTEGECFVAVADKNEKRVRKLTLKGNRQENILNGAIKALELLNEFVKNKRG